MTGKTHQIIGLTAGLATYLSVVPASYGPATLGAVVLTSSVAALMPDLDQPGAKLWRDIPLGRVAGELIDPFIAHRNLSHSLLGYGLFSWFVHWAISLLPEYWGIDRGALFLSFVVAYGSHLLADMVTVQGIPLLFPSQKMFGIPSKPFHGLRIITGKWFENLIVFPVANIALAAVIWIYWTEIKGILFK